MRGDDGAWGFNAGLTLDLGDATRIGLAYRSGITHEAGGTVRFATPAVTEPVGAAIVAAAMGPGGQLRNGPVSVDLELPDAALLSLCHEFGERYELLADVGWTGWSSVRELRIGRDTGELVSVTPEKWKDVLRYAIGGTYAASATLKLRAGIAYDGSAVPDKTRTPRLPEPARTWIAVGARWRPTRSVLFDFGYAHIFVEDAPLDQDAGSAAAYGFVNGTQKSSTDIVGAQLVYRF
jgi:long-chain fatty acid transport protein